MLSDPAVVTTIGVIVLIVIVVILRMRVHIAVDQDLLPGDKIPAPSGGSKVVSSTYNATNG